MNWFFQQSRRDQIALIVLAVCLLVYGVWMLGVKPLAAAAESSQTRYQAAAESLARVKALAATLQHHQANAGNQPQTQTVSMAGLIDRTTKANNLTFVTLNPSRDGQQATVRFDNAPLANLVQWLYQLETDYDTAVEDLNLVAGSEPGLVMATVRLSQQ